MLIASVAEIVRANLTSLRILFAPVYKQNNRSETENISTFWIFKINYQYYNAAILVQNIKNVKSCINN